MERIHFLEKGGIEHGSNNKLWKRRYRKMENINWEKFGIENWWREK